MSRWWQFYQTIFKKSHQLMVSKVDTASLAEQMEYYTPQYSVELSFYYGMICVLLWSLFVTGYRIDEVSSWLDLAIIFLLEVLVTGGTLLPSVFLIKTQQLDHKNKSMVKVIVRVLVITIPISLVVSLFMYFSANMLGFIQLDVKDIFIESLSHVIDLLILTSIILMFSIRRYRELKELKKYFNKQLETQNDHIKTRLAPHFFFNTINTLASLIEIDSQKASQLIQHVSHLFRASFNDPKESSLEEEIELCEHYLAIEHYRLQDKLVVVWDLPNEDLIYDMSITSLTLQNVLEQTVLHVVEMTTETVYIHVQVSWQNNVVTINVAAELPVKMFDTTSNMVKHINFSVQQSRLRKHYGITAKIFTHTVGKQVITTIIYPLHDAFS